MNNRSIHYTVSNAILHLQLLYPSDRQQALIDYFIDSLAMHDVTKRVCHSDTKKPSFMFTCRLRDESLTSSLLSDGRYDHDGGLRGHETPLVDAEHHRRHGNGQLSDCYDQKTVYAIDDNVQQYWCQEPKRVNGTIVDGEYNEGTTS